VRSLNELLDVHDELRERFALHRDFVVGLDFGRALAELETFERELRVHMDVEEAHVLPLYRERVGKITGGDPEFFLLEHRNILRNLDAAKESLRRLAADPSSGRRQAHEFLDQEWMLHHLIEHHDLREKNTLYPRLDEAVSEREREELLARCGLGRV
jgi:hemerythrin-like domain-containing protein